MAILWALCRNPTDLTLPVSSQTPGAISANAFTGWTSPAGTVYTVGAPSSPKKFCEANGDGRIAAKSTALWRDAEVTTYAQSMQVLLRLTATGKAFYFQYSANVTNGLLAIKEVSGINPALPIMNENFPANGAVVREIYEASGTLVAQFGPGGSVVDAGYSTTYASGHEFTFGVVGLRLYVKFKGITIIDLPYTAWTHMEAGQVALAPTSTYGVIDSSVDFRSLEIMQSVRDGLDNPSDFSAPAAPTVNLYDFGARALSDTATIAGGSLDTATVADASQWSVGDYVIFEVGTVAFTVAANGGNTGNGTLKAVFISDTSPSDWQTGVYTAVVQSGATQYRVTAPDTSILGTVDIEDRIDDGAVFQLMQGTVPFIAGDSFTITAVASGETATDTWDGLRAAGRVRTHGVGGVSPNATVTQAQIDANLNPNGYIEGTHVAITTGSDVGKVEYRGASSWGGLDAADVYRNRIVPLAHRARITAVGASTITFTPSAINATTNATVWLDNWYAITEVSDDNDEFYVYDNVTVRFPAGSLAFGETIWKNGGRVGWHFIGEGVGVTEIVKPRGITGNGIVIDHSDDGSISDFTYRDNDNPQGGWGMAVPTANGGNNNPGFPYGIWFDSCEREVLDRVTVMNPMGISIAFGNCTDCRCGPAVYDDEYTMNVVAQYPSLQYRGWRFASEASTNSMVFRAFKIDHAWFYSGFEAFGDTGVLFEHFHVINGMCNSNHSNNCIMQDAIAEVKHNSWYNSSVSIDSSPVIGGNQNQPGSHAGALLINRMRVSSEYFTEDDDLCRLFSIDAGEMIVRGTYVPGVSNGDGLITHPTYIAGNSNNAGAFVVSDGATLDVEGVRIQGSVGASGVKDVITFGSGSVARIVGNVMDNVPSAPPSPGTITASGNLSNAAHGL